jgi:hypothetical protein
MIMTNSLVHALTVTIETYDRVLGNRRKKEAAAHGSDSPAGAHGSISVSRIWRLS